MKIDENRILSKLKNRRAKGERPSARLFPFAGAPKEKTTAEEQHDRMMKEAARRRQSGVKSSGRLRTSFKESTGTSNKVNISKKLGGL